jgi:hypothetical protein
MPDPTPALPSDANAAEVAPAADASPELACEPRFADVPAAALEAAMVPVTAYFLKHVDELDYRNLDQYVLRANLRFAQGRPEMEVVDDLFLAARCLKDHASLHLSKNAPERFITRRVLPVELGMLSGQPDLTQEMGEQLGMPFSLILAGEVTYEVVKEVDLLTSFFRKGACATHRDLGGLGAIAYSGALAAICRGFDDEAAFILGMFNDITRTMLDKPAPDAVKPMLLRYDGLCLALSALVKQEFEALSQIIGQLIEQHEAEQRRKLGDKWARADASARFLDTASVALLASAALRQVALELPPSAAHYQGFVTVFTTAPPRVEEERPELAAADRALLRQMGMDPDKIEADLRKQAEDASLAVQEASAAAAITAATAGAIPADAAPAGAAPADAAPPSTDE